MGRSKRRRSKKQRNKNANHVVPASNKKNDDEFRHKRERAEELNRRKRERAEELNRHKREQEEELYRRMREQEEENERRVGRDMAFALALQWYIENATSEERSHRLL